MVEFEAEKETLPDGFGDQHVLEDFVAPGKPAHLPEGILYQAHWRTAADGMAAHARETVQALALSGLAVRLESLSSGGSFQAADSVGSPLKKVEHLASVTIARPLLVIKHIVFRNYETLRNQIIPGGGFGVDAAIEELLRRTILYTSWERDTVGSQMLDILQKLGRIWVPCEANRMAFISSGISPDKVTLIPYSFDPKEVEVFPQAENEAPKGKRFYFIGKWEPRKRPHLLVGAFLRAFTPQQDASLFIKTSKFGDKFENFPNAEECRNYWLDDVKVKANGWSQDNVQTKLRIFQGKLTEEQIQQLHRKNNIYVSQGYGEAWDIPAFEAKLAGNRLIYTDWGGPTEYASEEDIALSWQWSMVHPWYGWEPDAMWADVPMTSVVDAMKKASPTIDREIDPSIVKRCSRHSVANRIRADIEALLTELGEKVPLGYGG
jgi:glycosyltransferase involved in cell wall biosynthesis